MFVGAATAREIGKRPRLLKSCGISPLSPAAIGCPERNVNAVATLNGWRPHFEAIANEALYENDRTELVQYLKNAAHHAKMLVDLDSNS
jgi:hypothetical protein